MNSWDVGRRETERIRKDIAWRSKGEIGVADRKHSEYMPVGDLRMCTFIFGRGEKGLREKNNR